MKGNKIVGAAILMIFLISAFAFADLQILPEEQQQQEDKEQLCKDLARVGKQNSGEAKGLGCVYERKTGGSGGFYLAKGKNLFGMTSNYAGQGFGIVLGNLWKGTKKLYFPGEISKVELTSQTNQKGMGMKSKAFHLKKLDNAGKLLRYEFVSNMNPATSYALTFKVKEGLKPDFFLGNVDVPEKKVPDQSKKIDYYQVDFTGSGLLEARERTQLGGRAEFLVNDTDAKLN